MSRLAALALCALALGGCAAVDDAVKAATDRAVKNGYLSESQATSVRQAGTALRRGVEEISESEEYYIGRSVSAQILSRYKPSRDRALDDYLQTVLQATAMGSDRPLIYRGYHAQALASDEINAFSAPGGFVFVTTGLLKRLEDEDELAAVLGHELAHVSQKHGLKAIRASRLTSAFSILGKEAAKSYSSDEVRALAEHFDGAVDDVVNRLVVNGYSRDKEYEADRLGAEFAARAGFDPGGMRRFLARLEASGGAGGGLLKTHPAARDRLARLSHASGRLSSERAERFRAAVAAL